MGRLFGFLEERGLFKNTMIVFTSDHGDYLGDHWLGEKELFHETAVRIPLIVYDPDAAADATRGTVDTHFVEALDLLPTFLDATGVECSRHRLEGRSFISLLRGPTPADWRDCVFSEIDYGFYQAREILDVGPSDARGYMIRTERWKYMHYKGYRRPQLFDLENDPDEFVDLGESRDHEAVCRELHQRLFERLLARRNRLTMTDEQVLARQKNEGENGTIIGRW
jgi:arylsulfatase A-like enzyme